MTEWVTLYPQTSEPLREEVDLYVASPLWMELRAYLEKELHAASRVEYSRWGMEPGWNVKFKQGGRSLCTVYMRRGYVTAMVSIGAREENAAQLVLLACTAYTREVYQHTAASRMGRWLMLDVTSPEVLADVKALVNLRAKKVSNQT